MDVAGVLAIGAVVLLAAGGAFVLGGVVLGVMAVGLFVFGGALILGAMGYGPFARYNGSSASSNTLSGTGATVGLVAMSGSTVESSGVPGCT
jgi:hypothetical protein